MNKDEQEALEAKAVSLFEAKGLSAQQVADELGIGRATASRYRKKWVDDKRDHAVDAVSNLDPKTVLALADQLQGTSPALARNLSHLSESIGSLNKLEPIVHEAIGDLIVKVQTRIQDPNIKTSELSILGNLLLKSYATLYNRPQVEITVNQQQNVINQAEERIKGLTKGLIIDAEEVE